MSNNYRLDLTRTVTSGSTRKIAMGGAFTGLAEGNAAIPDNPAAVAYRARAFMRTWEFDMVMGSLVTTDDDVDNSGTNSLIYADHALADLGLMAQYKQFGIGGVASMSVYSSDDLPQDQEAQLVSGTGAIGYSAFDDQLAIGLSVNPIGARAKPKEGHFSRDTLRLRGVGYGAGVVWHPHRGHWRFGGAYTSRVTSQENLQTSSAPVKVGNLIVPNGVVIADQLSLGTAYEWNDFPLWRGRPGIATFDMRFIGPSPGDANGTDALVSQKQQPVGQNTILTLHGGLEVDAIPDHLRLRIGTYHEPSRYDNRSARQHITGGFEVCLFKITQKIKRPLSFSYAFDHAARYQVHSFSLWFWTYFVPVPEKGA